MFRSLSLHRAFASSPAFVRRRGAFLMAASAAVLLVVSSAVSLAADATVKISNFTFDPGTLSVPVGTTVTWVNGDDIPHLVSEKDGAFRSEALDTGDSFSHRFTVPGKVEYYCAIHPHMVGTIVVTP